MMAKKEIELTDLKDSYDWQEVFGEGGGRNTNKETDPCPPGSDIDTTPPSIADVAEVIAAVNGENDESSWVGLFRLADGRFLVATGSCDYTGWDCQAGNSLQVARTLEDAIAFGLTSEELGRLEL